MQEFLARLSEIPGYEWETDTKPFHSSYGEYLFPALVVSMTSSSMSYEVARTNGCAG
jgi:hypothetical protein